MIITINDRVIEVPEGTLILEAAQKMGLTVPHFCYHPRLKPIAACRLCLVEVAGMRGLQPSCATPLKEGMIVRTDSPPSLESHREVLDLVLEHHPLDCPKCEAAGRCQLEDFTYEFGPHRVSNYQPPGLSGFDYEETPWSPLIKFDPFKCVECTRCIRVCDEIHDCHALTAVNRGHQFLIAPFGNGPLNCDFCGSCASVCPTGAIEQQPAQFWKKDWEYIRREAICDGCAHGCTVILKTWDERIAKVDDDWTVGINRANLCARGRFGFDIVESEKRVRTPLLRKNGKLEPATWDEALTAAAEMLANGTQVEGHASGYLSVEDLYAFSRLLHHIKGAKFTDSRDGDVTRAIASKIGCFGSTVDFDQFAGFDRVAVIEMDVERIDYVAQIDAASAGRKKELIAIGRIGSRLKKNTAKQMPLTPGSVAACGPRTLFVADAERVEEAILSAILKVMAKEENACGLMLLASQVNSRSLGPLGFSACPDAGQGTGAPVPGPAYLNVKGPDGARVIIAAPFLEGRALDADVVFPSALAYEKPGTYVNSEGRAQFSAGAVRPQGEAWPDAAIWARLGKLLGAEIPQTPREMIAAAMELAPSLADRRGRVRNIEPPTKIGATRLPLYAKHDGLFLRHSKWTRMMTEHLAATKDFAPWPRETDEG